ncbi:MAG: DEAD/DEAH box helicase [Lactobacillaceae bacterium]|jgi:superfamily II DNA or RNA helicase|nr:DEAD/DEAH box helicase [Lactobacillaceae bacterium]
MDNFDDLRNALEFGFLDQNTQAPENLKPELVTNNEDETVLSHIYDELATSESFTFSVAFVTESGLITFKSLLSDLNQRGIVGRLITSNYLNFNSPKVYGELLKIPNLETRIVTQEGFHVKGYLFDHRTYQTAIIGSSNLTQNALKKNLEWNLKITSTLQGDLVKNINTQIEALWTNAIPLSKDFINNYKINYNPQIFPKLSNPISKIQPNKMQLSALKSLKDLRQKGETKGLVVSATGTGKTYLSAFDIKQLQPKRVLYLAHRKQILEKSLESFKEVLGGSDTDFAIYDGENSGSKYTFATVNLFSKPQNQTKFNPEHFDYILIDEAHRIADGDTMYQRILDYFNPRFLLGMTATPERTDGTNVYQFFDYNLAYEISLSDALEANLLTPFHYIGVTDYENDGQKASDTADLKYLTSDQRVDYLIEKTNYYGYSGETLKGLIFVSRIEEGLELSTKLNERGFSTKFISGSDSIAVRQNAVEQLQRGELQYLITVDIFNEGIDIPEVNQVVMMRPTISSIIFLQQLGRGLRKTYSKEYLTVIDFIGNYKNNFLIPMAFDKSRTSNKEIIRQNVIAPDVSGVSTINFEEIARTKILESIGNADFSSLARYKDAYFSLKEKIGNRPPMLLNFEERGSILPEDIINKFNDVAYLQDRFEPHGAVHFSKLEHQILYFLGKEIVNSKRLVEVVILKSILDGQILTHDELINKLSTQNIWFNDGTLGQIESILTMYYFMDQNKRKYGNMPLVQRDRGMWELSTSFKELLENAEFKKYVEDALNTAETHISNNYDLSQRFERNKKYTRADVIKLLNWNGEQPGIKIGGYSLSDDKRHIPVFITLDKSKKFDYIVRFENEFLDRRTFTWNSKTPRTLSSPTEKMISEIKHYGMLQIFIKRSDEILKDGNDFYYLGAARPESFEEVEIENKTGKKVAAVKYELQLENPVDPNLFKALVG